MKINNFTKTYKDFRLDINNLVLEEGKIYAVVGANGSGKSTLGKCIGGIVNNDQKIKCVDTSVGYLPQKPYGFQMSVKKNIALNTSDENKINELVNRLDINADKKSKELSGGQLAKMVLARSLVKDYHLLILDEPTAAMDMKSTYIAEELIKEYIDDHKIVLLITHSLPEAKRIADKIIYIDNGHIEEINDVNSFFTNPKSEKTKAFIEFLI